MNDELINSLIARVQNGEQISFADGAAFLGISVAEFCELWATTISPTLAAAKRKRVMN